MKRGLLIVFEGLDRSGKSTHTRMLTEYLQEKTTHGAQLLRFPNRTTKSGKIIDQYLRKEIELSDTDIHKLFSQNRHESLSEMTSLLMKGTSIVLDRYSYSGAVFSSAKGLDIKDCFNYEAGLIVPDIVLYMNFSPKDLVSRADYGGERYETFEFQTLVEQKFFEIQDILKTLTISNENGEVKPLASKPWVKVGQSANASVEELQAEIRTVIDDVLKQPHGDLEYFSSFQ